MAVATQEHRHGLKPGEVCGTCSLRAPPVKLCITCKRQVPDWPADEIGFLEANGWTLVNGQWLEPEERVMRSPTPEMVAAAMDRVSYFEAQFTAPVWGAQGGLARDKGRREELQTGLEKVRDKLARLQSGERFVGRARLSLSQSQAVQFEYNRTHDYNPNTIDREVRTFTDEHCETLEKQQRAMRGGVLLEADQDMIHERRTRKTTVHRSMCNECRQY